MNIEYAPLKLPTYLSPEAKSLLKGVSGHFPKILRIFSYFREIPQKDSDPGRAMQKKLKISHFLPQ